MSPTADEEAGRRTKQSPKKQPRMAKAIAPRRRRACHLVLGSLRTKTREARLLSPYHLPYHQPCLLPLKESLQG